MLSLQCKPLISSKPDSTDFEAHQDKFVPSGISLNQIIKCLEMDVWMAYWSNEFHIGRHIRILLRDYNFQKPFSSYIKVRIKYPRKFLLPSYGVPFMPCNHPFHLNKSSSLTGERSLMAGLGSFDSLVNSFTSRAAVEWLIKSLANLVIVYQPI